MAVVELKSTAITNADTSSQKLNSTRLQEGRLKESVGTVAAANGDSIGSIYRFARIPSGARVSEVILLCDAITSGAGDVGLYDVPTVNSGAVVDADFFASAQSIASAITTGTNIVHESGVYSVEDIEKPIWEALGLSADPRKLYDVAMTLTAATTAAGDVTLKVRYVDGN